MRVFAFVRMTLLACFLCACGINAAETVTYSISDQAVGSFERDSCSTQQGYGRVINPLHRAGHPETISPLAVPSSGCRYDGYYVGGSLPILGEGRCVAHEGTWGWDYFGILFPKRIALNWGHGVRSQGGSGAYKTDGPKLRHE